MLGNIVLGQYIPGNSLIHKLDPRVKILLSIVYMMALFFAWNYLSIIVVTLSVLALMFLSKIPVKLYIKSTKVIILFMILSAFLNLFYGEGEPIFKIGFISITQQGIQNSILVVLRIIDLIFISSILMFTTSPNDITFAIESLMKPLEKIKVNVQEIAMMMTIALRFIPTFLEETDKIMSAQKSRGAKFNDKSMIKRIKALIPILMPLFVSAFRRACDLALAMDCRCYDSSKRRTRMKTLKIGRIDIFAIIFLIVLFVGVIICSKMKNIAII